MIYHIRNKIPSPYSINNLKSWGGIHLKRPAQGHGFGQAKPFGVTPLEKPKTRVQSVLCHGSNLQNRVSEHIE